MKNIILRHRTVLLSDENKNKLQLNEHEIISAATLPELDDAYTKKVHNFNTITELYAWSSSINYLNNINLPMVFINSLDDPIIPENLLDPIRNFAGKRICCYEFCSKICTISYKISETRNNALYLELAHGGHLGFYEGGLLYPNPVTWLDRALVSLIGSLVLNYNDSIMKSGAQMTNLL